MKNNVEQVKPAVAMRVFGIDPAPASRDGYLATAKGYGSNKMIWN
jgi:hypothetical protein